MSSVFGSREASIGGLAGFGAKPPPDQCPPADNQRPGLAESGHCKCQLARRTPVTQQDSRKPMLAKLDARLDWLLRVGSTNSLIVEAAVKSKEARKHPSLFSAYSPTDFILARRALFLAIMIERNKVCRSRTSGGQYFRRTGN